MMALWKARGGSLNEELYFIDHGIVEGKGGGSLKKEVDFR